MITRWVFAILGFALCGAGVAAWTTGFLVPVLGSNTAGTVRSGASIDSYPIRFTLPQSRPFANTAEVAEAYAVVSDEEDKLDFAAQMGIDPATARMALSTAPGATAAIQSRNGLLALDFDLSRYGAYAKADGGGGVRDTKQLIVGGQAVGTIPLLISEGATVSVDRQTLLTLVGERDPALAASLARVPGEQVTFEALRSRDVAIRYDPLADTVVIETKS